MMFRFLFAATLLAAVGCARADIILGPLFASGCVLQRGIEHPLWGRADPGERVRVEFAGQSHDTVADAQGRWRVALEPLAPSSQPRTLVARGHNRIELTNILVGDVWLCSGQSNMEWAVSTALNPEAEAKAADFPLIRHCKVVRTVAEHPAETVETVWQACSPQTVLRFSAVGYFFARDFIRATGVPVGIVTSAWGGTQVESWIPGRDLKAEPAFAPVFERWSRVLADYPNAVALHQRLLLEWNARAAEASARGAEFKQRRPADAEGPGSRWLPGGLYNGMIQPLTPFPFRGVLWYQGEANEFRAAEYARLFQTMVGAWRREFGRPDLPFYFVQLANFATRNDPTSRSWAYLREAQAAALVLPHTGMVVTVDIGDDHDIHFKNKQETGRRLALIARAQLLGEPLEFSGPLYASSRREDDAIRLTFSHARNLTLRDCSQGFEIAGVDRKFVPATARIEGETVVVSARGIADPVAVRYAWHNTPRATLFNGAGLPASPFRTDTW